MGANNNIKAVVMGGRWDTGRQNDVLTIYHGAYENIAEAYGEALLYLNEEASDYDGKKKNITPLYELEANQGFGMELHIEGEDLAYFAHIFINYDCAKNQGEKEER